MKRTAQKEFASPGKRLASLLLVLVLLIGTMGLANSVRAADDEGTLDEEIKLVNSKEGISKENLDLEEEEDSNSEIDSVEPSAIFANGFTVPLSSDEEEFEAHAGPGRYSTK